MRLVYDPAGRDNDLRRAVQSVQAGRWMEMRRVLAQPSDWSRWTARTQVLGVSAARSNVVELWMDEEPNSTAAQVMYARVATQRALHAHRALREDGAEPTSEQQGHVDLLADNARQACVEAANHHPEDPVPWICRVALAEMDTTRRYPEHRLPPPPPEMLLPAGPWGLLGEADKRDPHNREAWHRMLQVLRAWGKRTGIRQAVTVYFARWAVSQAPAGSALLVLPLYAHVDEHRDRRARGDTKWLHLYWRSESIIHEIRRAFRDWFRHSDPATCSLTDLNYMAHALHAGRFTQEGAEVFRAIGGYATPTPWQYIADDPNLWQEKFLAARASCLKSRSRPRRRR